MIRSGGSPHHAPVYAGSEAKSQAKARRTWGMVNMRRKPSAVLFDFFNTIVRRVNFDPEMGIRTLLKLAKKPSSISIHEVLVRNTTLEDRLCEVWDTSNPVIIHKLFKLQFVGI